MLRKQRRDERKRGFEERKMASLLAAKRIDDQVFLVKSLRKVKNVASVMYHTKRGGGSETTAVCNSHHTKFLCGKYNQQLIILNQNSFFGANLYGCVFKMSLLIKFEYVYDFSKY